MNATYLTLGVSLLAIIVVVAICHKLDVFRNRQQFWMVIRNAFTDKVSAIVGLAAVVIYGVIYLFLGGSGGRIHYFYGHWIFDVTALDILVALVSAALIGVVMALFSYSIKMLGIFRSKPGGVGIVGTVLALVASLCP